MGPHSQHLRLSPAENHSGKQAHSGRGARSLRGVARRSSRFAIQVPRDFRWRSGLDVVVDHFKRDASRPAGNEERLSVCEGAPENPFRVCDDRLVPFPDCSVWLHRLLAERPGSAARRLRLGCSEGFGIAAITLHQPFLRIINGREDSHAQSAVDRHRLGKVH